MTAHNIPAIGFDISDLELNPSLILKMYDLITHASFFSVNFKINKHWGTNINHIVDQFCNSSIHLFIYTNASTNTEHFQAKYPNLHFRKSGDVTLNPKHDFIITPDFYFESLDFNPFFNRKLFVSKEGDVLTAPDIKYKIGTLADLEIVISPALNQANWEPWNIPKRKINICKVCEFRQMCCSANIPYKVDAAWKYEPACNYDPFTNEWKY